MKTVPLVAALKMWFAVSRRQCKYEINMYYISHLFKGHYKSLQQWLPPVYNFI